MVVIIDPQNSGISGNMMVGALASLGVDHEDIISVMEHYASHFGDVKVEISQVKKSGISATYADVNCRDKEPVTYMELLNGFDSINHPDVGPEVTGFVKKVFKTLAEAESKVHGTTMEKVHFHEVGAADAVADVVGAAYSFFKLGLNKQKVYGMPVALGGGRIKSMHGVLSVPAPATLEILRNVPTFGGPVEQELATPTGAALLVNMVDEFCKFYPMVTDKTVVYGAGKYELSIPNVLRIITGDSHVPMDKVYILETNLDNVTGEVLGHTFDRLMEKGARDVTIIPTLTKKNRPGHLLRVITKPEDSDAIAEAIIRETGTLGVRFLPYSHRSTVSREIVPVEVDVNGMKKSIRIKVGLIGEDIVSSKTEYEDAKEVSIETGIPVKDIMAMAEDAFKKFKS
ncbi:nickel pincer cofactor biosynthesis protein LarC [Methanobacterium aggregans]|uniref:nickel pincer cofactor biosynthesis protein LarC n=2 Tax=Methanobacterium aggregans TaxID=1615586 RepID=UPI001AE986C6|nr:nickel pincer cofactor biosynthesis protein LarC [Methanobacterium aggregans]MBP2046245.1 uncharacterized protein (TIGR00299 family) protein [Methanobacterium aggregans]